MLEKQKRKKKSACSFLSSRIYTDFVWGKIAVIKKKYIPGNLFVVIISPFTNHFTTLNFKPK